MSRVAAGLKTPAPLAEAAGLAEVMPRLAARGALPACGLRVVAEGEEDAGNHLVGESR